jgi:hypothetical protein
MFKLQPNPTFWHPVTIPVCDEDQQGESTIKIEFRHKTKKQLAAFLKQGKKSVLNGKCRYRLYRDDGDLSCAAGCLVSDDEYDAIMECQLWHDLAAKGVVPTEHCMLIRRYQQIHDNLEPAYWPAAFKCIDQDDDSFRSMLISMRIS